MSKSAEAFRTISEVADALDTPAHVLRFWESRFSQIKPVKRAGGRRYYRPGDVALLAGIRKLLHDDGMTIRGVQKMLREQGVKAIAALSDVSLGESTGSDTGAEAARKWPAGHQLRTALPDDQSLTDAEEGADSDHTALPVDPGEATSRPNRAPGPEARAELERQRSAPLADLHPLAPETHFDPPYKEGDFIPAAAMVRAMTTYRIAQKKDHLVAIYKRLNDLYERRRASDQ
ncbi:MAG: MerR family transcriptional regulator [Paracoccaceae bacterium]